MKFRNQWAFVVCVIAITSFSRMVPAEPPTPASIKNKIVTYYGSVIDLSQIVTALNTPPEKLIKYIESQGVQVMKVAKADKLKVPKNPVLKELKEVPQNLIQECDLEDLAESDDATYATFINSSSSFCPYGKNWIVISDSAMTFNLIHEFFHYVLFIHQPLKSRLESGTNHQVVDKDLRTFKFRFKKVIMGRGDEFDNPLWRRDFLEAIQNFSISLEPGIKYFLSEEVVIERTLAKLAQGTIYNDKERLELGEKYAKNNLSQILAFIQDLAFAAQWSEGELKSRRALMTVRELEANNEQLIRINAQIKRLADIYLKVKSFQP